MFSLTSITGILHYINSPGKIQAHVVSEMY